MENVWKYVTFKTVLPTVYDLVYKYITYFSKSECDSIIIIYLQNLIGLSRANTPVELYKLIYHKMSILDVLK